MLYKYITDNSTSLYVPQWNKEMNKLGFSLEELIQEGYKPLIEEIEPECPENSYLIKYYEESPKFITQKWEICEIPIDKEEPKEIIYNYNVPDYSNHNSIENSTQNLK